MMMEREFHRYFTPKGASFPFNFFLLTLNFWAHNCAVAKALASQLRRR